MHDFIKPKYQFNAKLCYMDTYSFILKLKMFVRILQMMLKKDLIHQIMKSINQFQQQKTKKVIELMKDKLGGKIMTEFVALRSNTQYYVMDDGNSDEKT